MLKHKLVFYSREAYPPELLSDYDHETLGHVTSVTVGRRWFRTVYYVRCWQCDLCVGPFKHRLVASEVAREFWATNYKGFWKSGDSCG